jgi:flavin reductase (DIM6/NTAB) family NADH-FMN oxidoreductase RutF
MELQRIAIDDLQIRCHQLWDSRWLLLTAGDLAARRYNPMTVAWGSFGTMWSRPFAQVVVRPTRHTYLFTEQYDTFTLCAFSESCRPILKLMGTRSGRDIDKTDAEGLTPLPSLAVAAPGFAEAELIVECRKIYYDDIEPGRFLLPELEDNYPQKDYHRIYFGEILAVRGTDQYRVGRD